MSSNSPDAAGLPPVVEEALSHLNDIATLPEVAQQVMRVADDPESDADDIVDLVSSDPVLVSRVLRVVNSSFYGTPGEVGSIHQAVVILGLNAVKNIAIAASLGKIFRNTQMSGFYDARELWQHGTAVACAGKLLASRVRLDAEQAFLLGMLHDIGLVLEVQFARDAVARVVERHCAQPSPAFVELERELVGASHQEFGQALCARWQFPELMQRVVGAHHEPDRLEGEERRYALLLALADQLAHQADAGYIGSPINGGISQAYADELDLSNEDLEAVLAELPEALELASVIGG